MSIKRFLGATVAALALSLALYARLQAQAAPEPAGPTYPVDPNVLGGPDRYLTYVSTDKPIYREGETVYVRAVTLQATSRQPYTSNPHAQVEVKGPKGDTVASGDASGDGKGAIGFSWLVPAGMPGGEYKVVVTVGYGLTPAERTFDIRAFRPPRLKSQIQFVRDGYGPGDTVMASLHTERAEGGIPKNAKVTVSARVDDAEVYTGVAKVDAGGNAGTMFKLPTSIARGEGTLAMTIEDGGVVETATKTIPILLQTIDLTMYPEGGDLVGGLPCRVYVEAKTPAKKPADLEAAIVDDGGNQVASFKTEHEGRGRVSFTPAKGRRYSLKILAPSGIKTTYALPKAKEGGAVMAAATDIVKRGEPAKFRVIASKAGTYTLTVSQRETSLGSAKIHVGSGGWFSSGSGPGKINEVSVPLPSLADGVLIATLWDSDRKPLAERLLFREPAKPVQVTVKANQESYVPGGKVKIDVTTTDEKGRPVGAVVGVTVTDESVLEMIEKREQAPRLPVMVFLEPEVKELADAHVYLDAKNPKAPVAVDLLLGTQGWRRFALMDAPKFLETYGDQARRALAIVLPPPPPPEAMPMMAAEAAPVALAAPPPMPPPAPPPAPAPVQKRKAGPPPAEVPPAVQHRQAAQGGKDQPAKPRIEAIMAAGRRAAKRAEAGKLMAEDKALVQNAFVYVREYAHQARPGRKPNDRIDFAETLYWTAGLTTDSTHGKATFTFDMSDAVTAFRVAADAFTAAGAIGIRTASVKSVQPFYVEPKVPLQVTSKDVIQLPVALVNSTAASLDGVRLEVAAAKGITVGDAVDKILVAANGRTRRLMRVAVGNFVGSSEIVATANAGNYSDQVTRMLDVRPLGFPIQIAKGGLLEADATETFDLEIPSTIVQGSLVTEVAVFPTPLGNLTQALTSLMQEPNGCFEQTSSSNYPLAMAQQYFTTHQGVDPKIVEKSNELLTRGYQRLVSFECKDQGYEWFGGASPGHEALTAYGLMEFADMGRAKIAMLDQKMVERTRDWLRSRRDGKGGYRRNQRALDSFGGAPEETTNAYITWALVEAGEKGLEKEIAALKKSASASGDSYVVALGANVAAKTGDMAAARPLMQKLVAKQDKKGFVGGASTSITQSGGDALAIETTSLATLAWLQEPKHAGEVERAMKYLTGECEGGRFSSTQATLLALKAIVAYDGARAKPRTSGSIQLVLDGKPVGPAAGFGPETQGAISLPSLVSVLTAGKHTVELKMAKGGRMPYTAAFKYNAVQPASSDKTKLSLATTLHNPRLQEGKVTEIRVEVANVVDAAVPMPVAIIGVPGGLEVRHDQLKELVKSEKIAAYEVLGREVVLYWRQLKAKEKVSLPISVVAAIPGKYQAPASRVYEYYTDELKRWVPGVVAEITPLDTR